MKPLIQPLGDATAIVEWPGVDEQQASEHAWALYSSLKENRREMFVDLVPGFASLTFHYSAETISWREILETIQAANAIRSDRTSMSTRVIEIPVCYDEAFATDLAELAAAHQLSTEDVVKIHCSAEYSVRMIGFSPGFPYLAGLPEVLITPRRKTPRLRVPAGSVAIGGRQTGIYSLETPGGWHIVGRTPLAMFRPDLEPPCFLNVGDRVRFIRISPERFHELQVLP